MNWFNWYKLSFMLFILAVNGFGRAAMPKLLLTLYYESQCPDSKYFVLQQLLPVMQRLHEYVRVQYVPFGKAMSIESGYGGFECQHGDSECFGNIIQDCTLDFLNQRGSSDLEKLNYVACEMDTYAATKGDLQCVVRAKVMPDAIQQCLNSGRGTALQLNSEYLTKLVHPTFIPTVTIKGVRQTCTRLCPEGFIWNLVRIPAQRTSMREILQQHCLRHNHESTTATDV